MSNVSPKTDNPIGAYLAWVIVGACASTGVGAIFTPWMLLVIPAGGLIFLLLRSSYWRYGWPGWIAGVGLVSVVLAIIYAHNRDLSPLPFVITAAVLLVLSIGIAVTRSLKRQ